MASLTIAPADLDGLCSRVFKMTPVFTGRVFTDTRDYGP